MEEPSIADTETRYFIIATKKVTTVLRPRTWYWPFKKVDTTSVVRERLITKEMAELLGLNASFTRKGWKVTIEMRAPLVMVEWLSAVMKEKINV